MTALHSRRGSPAGPSDAVTARRLGQVYLDVRQRKLFFLNDAARQLRQDGVPFTPADLDRQPLQTLNGVAVTATDLPLIRAWREAQPQEAIFVLVRAGGIVQHVTWSTAPLWGAEGDVVGISGSLLCGPPEPDWQLLAGLAHDLRNPLHSLKLLLSLLESSTNLDAAQQRTVLDHIRSSAERAQLIGLDLLEWCRGPALGGRRVQQTWFPLEPFLTALTGEQAAEANRKSLTLAVDLAAVHGWEVYTDRVRLSRLLANLLSNAVRYTHSGKVQFTTAWRDDGGRRTLVLSVVDTGTGIPPEEQESIFQPFERGRAGKDSDSGGSGVGLSVVDRLVEELGLELEVYSEYGRGSAFHLVLPAALLRPAGGQG